MGFGFGVLGGYGYGNIWGRRGQARAGVREPAEARAGVQRARAEARAGVQRARAEGAGRRAEGACRGRVQRRGQARAIAIASILQSTYRLYIVCRCYTDAQYVVCPNGNVKGLLNLGIFGENSGKIGGNPLTKAGRVCYNIDATLKIG